jgi:predicted DNA-binding transcriptional regulator AlpA
MSMPIAKRRNNNIEPEVITLAEAARRLGVAVETAAKLGPAEGFPPPFWLGGRRCLGRARFEQWLQAKIDGRPAA